MGGNACVPALVSATGSIGDASGNMNSAEGSMSGLGANGARLRRRCTVLIPTVAA